MSKSKAAWPLNPTSQEKLRSGFERIDKARTALAKARSGGIEDEIDDAVAECIAANEAVLEMTVKLADHPFYQDDEHGWKPLGAPLLGLTDPDAPYGGKLPNLGEGEEFLANGNDPEPERVDPEYKAYERSIRVCARTGWMGLDSTQRRYLESLRDQAKSLHDSLKAWLEATK